MKVLNARFSYERRVKLIFIMLSAIFAAAVMLNVHISAESGTAYAHGHTNLLRTSRTEDNYAVIECVGDTVTARGQYTFDKIAKMGIAKCSDASGSYSIKSHGDGTFESEITAKPESDGEYPVVLVMKSGVQLIYRMFYESGRGWYFPVNGLNTANRKVFEHIFEAPAEASALYLSSSDDPQEINAALEQIKGLTEEVTEGIDDDYEKAKAISQFISKTYYYDMDARHNDADLSTIALYNVLKSSKTVCGGYANMFCAMAEAAGLDAVNIKGGVTTSDASHPVTYDELPDGHQNHEWAAFWYEKEQRWVWVDSCWDTSAMYENGKYDSGLSKLMYFDISDEAFSFNHRADKAERRHYFAAKTETQPVADAGTETETSAPEETETAETSSLSQTDSPSETTTALSSGKSAVTDAAIKLPEADSSTLYIVIIAALICAVAAAAVILIKVLKNGRKK